MNKEELVKKLITIKEQEKEIRKQIDTIDYENRFNDAKKYEGKYFKEENSNDDCIRCLYVYATDKERCNPMTLCVNYWLDNETSYFDINYYDHFHPKKWDDGDDKWVEISKDEYMKHYKEVQRRISLALEPSDKK